MKYRVVQSPKITGFLTSVSDCRPPCVLGNKFPSIWISALLTGWVITYVLRFSGESYCYQLQKNMEHVWKKKRKHPEVLKWVEKLKEQKGLNWEGHSPLKKIWGSQRPWASTRPPPPFQGSQLPADLASTEVISREPQLHPPQEFSSEHILSLEGDLRNK